MVLLVGCSHPGIVNIARRAIAELKIPPYAIIGGFHTFNISKIEAQSIAKQLKELGFKKIAPIHCSGDIIREATKETPGLELLNVMAGDSL